MGMPYKTERWVVYAHRVSLIGAVMLVVIAVVIGVVAFVSPFTNDLRYYYALAVLAASAPLWLVAWLLRQAQTRAW